MKNFIKCSLSFVVGILMSKYVSAEEISSQTSLYSITATSIRGQKVNLNEYKGKVALIVNTASKCGFTSQYEGLEKLYKKYKDKNFIILGFPSDDFGHQEPGNNQEIENFCKVNYGVSFPLFEKAAVKGELKQPAYKILTEQSAGSLRGDPGWNFVKFLVDKDGYPRARFSSMTSPDSSKIEEEIEKLLNSSSYNTGNP